MSNPPPQLHPKYRPDIDGLRAIAVLSVIAFHAFPEWISGGFIGVDIFFVISGYLISTIIFENLDRGIFSFWDFYSRRIRRIFPALTFVLIFCFTIGWFTLFESEYKQIGKHMAGGASFLSNFFLWNESGYFDNIADTKPLLHLWSLGIEEQFYIVWPILLWLTWKSRANFLAITLFIVLTSFIINIVTVYTNPVAAFYSPLSRFWELLIGAILAYVVLYKKELVSRFTASSDFISIIGLSLFIVGIGMLKKTSLFPGWWALLPTLGGALLILAGPNGWVNNKILSSRVLVWFGLISFPLYLWHWPLFSFARIIKGEVSAELRFALVAFSIGLAWLTYRFIEKPIRLSSNKKFWLITLICALLFVGFIGFNTYTRDGLGFRSVVEKTKDFNSKPELDGYTECQAKLLVADELNMCRFNPAKKTTAALIGDSHAEDKFYGIIKNDPVNNWMLIANSGCPPVLGVEVDVVATNAGSCKKKFENIFAFLAAEKSIELVALSFFGHYFEKGYAADHVTNGISDVAQIVRINNRAAKTRDEIFEIGLENAVNFLEAHGKKVIIFIDIPELPFFPKDCLRDSSKICVISKQSIMARQAPLRKIVGDIQSKHPAVTVYDPLPIFCTNDFCGYKKDDIIMYHDPHHLTPRGSDIFGKDFLNSK